MLRRPSIMRTWGKAIAAAGYLCACVTALPGQNVHLTIPRRSIVTPVQQLNREGVDAVLKLHYEKAESLFYKAYLYDPVDPFTLNNLGYVSELHGDTEQAEKFYKLALAQGCDAIIDRTDALELKGKPMMFALSTAKDMPLRTNRINVLGMEYLSQDRPFDAESLLKDVLATDPKNPFTLNNLGVVEEAAGDLEGALSYYRQAAELQSKEPVVVTPNRAWRGKPITELALASEAGLEKRMKNLDLKQIRATMLTMRGVHAINRNQSAEAKAYFLEAYALDPQNPYFLNNRGYVAEQDGDTEAAKLFYAAAERASTPNARVGAASEAAARGQRLTLVSSDSVSKVDARFAAQRAERQRSAGIPTLKRRVGLQSPTSAPPLDVVPQPNSANPAPQPQP